MAAAMGSATRNTSRAPACLALSRTARFSTSVMPEGTQITMRGAMKWRFFWAILMNSRSMYSVTSKSAITPSFMGRIAAMLSGVLPSMALASAPTA